MHSRGSEAQSMDVFRCSKGLGFRCSKGLGFRGQKLNRAADYNNVRTFALV
jgi:hypothetical protein